MRNAAQRMLVALAAGAAFAVSTAVAGADVYAAQCAVCHQAEGAGLGPFPALVDNAFVEGAEGALVSLVLRGRDGMPPFANLLDDAAIAAVLTHVRSAWGNDAAPIDEQTVAEVRADAEPAVEIAVDLPDDWRERGEVAYLETCAACHGAGGLGIPGAFPALAENAFVQGSAEALLRVLLNGRAGMPAFAGSVDNERLALISSYVRSAWGNEAHPVDAEMVSVVRGGGDLDLAPSTPTTRPGAAD